MKFQNNIRGEIIDVYGVKTKYGEYQIIRTNYQDKYLCWYLLFKKEIVTIHTEKKPEEAMKSNEIILSDFNNDDVPEFTFFYNNYNLIKCIHFDGENKTIAKKETKRD